MGSPAKRITTEEHRSQQPLKWWGGKWYLSEWLGSMLPPHKHRVHVYAGGLGETRKWPQRGYSLVANDRNGWLINFYRVLQDESLFEQFQRRLAAIPFARVEWKSADALMRALIKEYQGKVYKPKSPDLNVAAVFFVWNRQSMSGRMDIWTPLTRSRTRGARNAEVNAWAGAVEGLPAVKAFLDNYVLECDLDLAVIGREDGPDTFMYLDPPYLVDGSEGGRTTANVFLFDMQPGDHEALLRRLTKGDLQGKYMLSGYPSRMYDDYLLSRGWKRFDKRIDNKAQKGKIKKIMLESVYLNYTP